MLSIQSMNTPNFESSIQLTMSKQQRAIAESFRRKSAAIFECYAGAIDGILVWIHKPSADECAKAGCSETKFFCGRNHKLRLNCQAVCNSNFLRYPLFILDLSPIAWRLMGCLFSRDWKVVFLRQACVSLETMLTPTPSIWQRHILQSPVEAKMLTIVLSFAASNQH